MKDKSKPRSPRKSKNEVSNLEGWNGKRGNWQVPASRWQDVPPPKSLDEYGEVRTR
jgi:hypothetical protein